MVNPPRATFNGADAQLDAALKYLENKMVTEPVKSVTPQVLPRRGEPGWDMH